MASTVVGLRSLFLATIVALAAGACGQPPGPAAAPADGEPEPAPPPPNRLFFEDFEGADPGGDLSQWEPQEGTWDVQTPGRAGSEYGPPRKHFALSAAGNANWKDYVVEAAVTVHDDRFGPAGVAGRVQSGHFYYELLLGRNDAGVKSWFLRQRLRHAWTTLATGSYDYQLGVPQTLRLAIKGQRLEASVARGGGASLRLGVVDTRGPGLVEGRIGLVSYGGEATFDDVSVTGEMIYSEAEPWGPLIEIRDNTNFFPTGKPAGGWYVAAIHATLRPNDGRVLINGYSRKGASNCSSAAMNSSQNGTTWILDPETAAPPTLFIQPINEQPLISPDDVIYCAGHVTMPGGRVFFSGGSRHPGGYPFSSERGLNYARVFDFATNSVTRISAPMRGGTVELPGEKWYPTSVLMPEGTVLTFGGFTFNSGGTGPRMNQSLELFDPAAWDANRAGNPWTVLTTHNEGSNETTPTRGYTNLFVLPKPIAAGTGGGLARTVALSGGVGKVFLFNHEPGPTGAQRLLARPNALTPNTSATEKGEGASGVVLPDGRLMYVNGGHLGSDAAKAYFYTPTTDSWTSVALGTSRIYGDALFLPDGRIMIINGYVSEPGNVGDVSNPIGDVRSPEIIDPWSNPPTVTTLPPWPDLVWRGYHSIAMVLKDARVLVAAGKDNDHATGCEKSNMRIYEPPYLFGEGDRPTINLAEGTAMTVGGSALTVPFAGTVRSTRGVALMAPGSLTHGFDMGQRYVPLSFVDNGDGTVTVSPPENTNVAPPGEYLMYVISTSGVPSVGKHIRLAAPPPCRYAVDGANTSYLEAEARSRQSGPFTAVTDPARAGGAYVAVTEAGLAHTTEPDEGKVLWYDVDVANGGSFVLWALANGPDANADSFWVSVDGTADVQLDLPAGWGWVRPTGTLNLPTGKHTLKIKVREDGALIDKLLLTKSTSFTPTGLGGTTLVCNGLPAPSGLSASPGNGVVNLTWSPVSGATSYTVKRSTSSGTGYVTVQAGIPGTSFNSTGLSNGTPYFFVVSAVNAVGESPNSSEATATPVAAPTWSGADIGAVAAAGSFTQTGGTTSVRGSGADIYGTADEFHYVYQTITGDVTITARVTAVQMQNVWSKAGVMMRENITGAGARNVMTLVSPTTSNLYRFQARTAAGGSTTSTAGGSGALPVTLRLVRAGNTFTGFFSTNGTTFTQIGATQTIAMGSTIRVGLAVTSHNDGQLSTGTFDNVVISTSTPTPPAPPGGLSCTAGNGLCTLSWSASPGATSYNVKRSLTSGSGHTTVGTTPSSGFTDSVSNGSTYFYVVTAVNAAGESANSTQVSCQPVAPAPPNGPTNLVVVGGAGQAQLTWTDNASNETGSKIERKTQGAPDTSYAQVGTVGANATTFTDTVAAGSYTWRVKATNAAGDSPASNSADATVTTPSGPAAPSNLNATVAGGNAATLTWTDGSNNETGFRVERKVGAGAFVTLATKAANVTSHVDTGLTANSYTYRVIATGTPNSAPSNEVVVLIANPAADAYVRSGTSAGTNFGAATVIDVKTTATTTTRRNGFVRFALAGVGATVTSAKLRLFGNAVTSAKATNVHSVANITWGESTITWNTPTTDAGGPPMSGTPLATQTVGLTAGYVEWDVTAYVQGQRTAGAAAVTLGVKSGVTSDEGQTTFNAKEGVNKPLLVITSRP